MDIGHGRLGGIFLFSRYSDTRTPGGGASGIRRLGGQFLTPGKTQQGKIFDQPDHRIRSWRLHVRIDPLWAHLLDIDAIAGGEAPQSSVPGRTSFEGRL